MLQFLSTDNLSILAAFTAGMVSFLSPCVLPLIPGFLAYLAGVTFSESVSKRKEIFLNSFFFVLGFSLIFSLLGVLLNTILKVVAYDVQIWLSRIGGILVIFFGLYLTHLIKIPFLDANHQFSIKHKFKSRYLTSVMFGAAFAAGWIPCVGAVLGGILGLATAQPELAFILLLVYSLGLSLPFLVVGLFVTQANNLIIKYGYFLNYASAVFGIILIILGVLVFTQSLSLVANFSLLNNILLRR